MKVMRGEDCCAECDARRAAAAGAGVAPLLMDKSSGQHTCELLVSRIRRVCLCAQYWPACQDNPRHFKLVPQPHPSAYCACIHARCTHHCCAHTRLLEGLDEDVEVHIFTAPPLHTNIICTSPPPPAGWITHMTPLHLEPITRHCSDASPVLQHIALTIGEEVDLHTRLLEELDEDVDVTHSRLRAATKRVRYILKHSSNWKGGLFIFLLIVVLTLVILVATKVGCRGVCSWLFSWRGSNVRDCLLMWQGGMCDMSICSKCACVRACVHTYLCSGTAKLAIEELPVSMVMPCHCCHR